MRRVGFSLLELLLVLAITVVLGTLATSVASNLRRHARDVECKSNLRQLGLALQAYQNENNGWLFPIIVDEYTGMRRGRGIDLPPHLRWPMFVFDVPGAPGEPPYDPASYTREPYDPVKFPAAPYTPAVLRCPADEDPAEAHSYVLNDHLGRRAYKAGTRSPFRVATSQIVVAGEKVSEARDYLMEMTGDYDRVLELHRHHPRRAGNFLYLDGHADDADTSPTEGPGVDPWDPGPR